MNDYAQCANDKPGSVGDPLDCVPQSWINGILNPNNSQYREDQVTPQRVGLDLPNNGPTTGRTITITYLARKGQGGAGNHAYDSLATWNYTETNADRCQDLLAADCPGGSASTSQIPSDPTVVADSNGAGSSTALHELPAANRMMTMYGGTIDSVSAPIHDNAAGPGDDYASVTVTYHVASTPTKVQLLFGGHLAPSVGPRGWGSNVGASFINGGPYHIRLDSVDSSSLGNRDNQIMSGAILPVGTATKTALHETNSLGVDVNPANNQDPVTQTGITVTLPTNGSGTYVTDYATVAPPGSTGTVAFRYYSSQAACNADTTFAGGSSAGSGKTLDANSVAKSDPVHITAAGVTYWRAVFTGTGISASSDSGCSEEILTANQATSTSTTLHETTSLGADVNPANNGDPISINAGGYVTDYASVTPNSATGSVAFKWYATSSDCTGDTNGTAAGGGSLSSGSAKSNTVQFNNSGTFYWKAFFTGTNNNNNSQSSCEVLNVRQPTSTSTTLHETNSAGVDVDPDSNGDPISVNAGDYVTDYASVTPNSATGSVAFKYYGSQADCSNDANGTAAGGGSLTSGSAHSNTVQFNTSGTFYWKAFFTGTGLNNNSQSSCEVLNVRQPTSTTTTLHETDSAGVDVDPANNGDPISVNAGGYVTDYASVTPNSATGSVAFKWYASQSDCTNDTNGTAAGGGSLSSGSAHSNTVQFNTSGTFYWKAFFTGTGLNNNSQSSCEVLNVRQPTSTTTTLHETDANGADVNPANNGDPISVNVNGYVTDYASVLPVSAAGSVAFKWYGSSSDCTGGTNGTAAGGGSLSSGSAKSNTVQFNTSGTFYWKAFFTGTGLNNNSQSSCEVLHVALKSPDLTTIPNKTTGAIGDQLSDTGTLSGSSATSGGTISFYLFAPGDDCSDVGTAVYSSTGVAVSGDGTYNSSDGTESGSNTTTVAGTYHWLARYSGDTNNNPASSKCSDEAVAIGKNSPGLTTTPNETTGAIGDHLSDTGTLSGSTANSGGTLSFYLFAPGDDCSELGTAVYSSTGVAVSGDGTYNSSDGTESGSNTTTVAGTYHWLAKYSGDDNNDPASSKCTDEAVAISPNSPGLTTTPSETTGRIGDALSDTGTLSGATSDAGGTLSFYLFGPGDDCSDLGTAVYSSTGVAVSGNGTYNSADGTASGSNTTTVAGTYHWLAKYSGDDNNDPASSKCSDEAVLVISPHITILKTPDQQTIVSGQTATFTIQVINDGDSNLTNVVVTDALAPGCARTSADIPGLALMKPTPDPSGTITYQCTLANVTASFTNTAVATGKPPVGPDVSSQDTAAVTVVQPVTHPAIQIVKDPKSQTVTKGNTATFTITVLNTGDVALTDVVVTDALSSNCNKTIGNLAPGQSVSYQCTRPNVQSSFTNVAVVTGKAGGTTVTDQDTAPVTAKAPFVPKVVPKVVSHKKPKATG